MVVVKEEVMVYVDVVLVLVRELLVLVLVLAPVSEQEVVHTDRMQRIYLL